MAKQFSTYDFNEVDLIVGGLPLSGFQGGSNIGVEYNTDAWTFQPNVDGGGTRSKSNNLSGRITFTLSQGSESNNFLSALAQIDQQSNGGAVPASVTYKSGSSVHVAENAWIVKIPRAEYSGESAGREWVLESDNLVSFLGSD